MCPSCSFVRLSACSFSLTVRPIRIKFRRVVPAHLRIRNFKLISKYLSSPGISTINPNFSVLSGSILAFDFLFFLQALIPSTFFFLRAHQQKPMMRTSPLVRAVMCMQLFVLWGKIPEYLDLPVPKFRHQVCFFYSDQNVSSFFEF